MVVFSIDRKGWVMMGGGLEIYEEVIKKKRIMSFSASFCQNVLALPCVINMVPNGRLNPIGSMLLVQEKKTDLKNIKFSGR